MAGERMARKNTLQVIDGRWWGADKPKEEHVDAHARRSKDSGPNTGVPHRRNPPLVGTGNIGIRPSPNNARVAVAVIEEIGELETR